VSLQYSLKAYVNGQGTLKSTGSEFISVSGFDRDYSLNTLATGIIDIAERLALFPLDKYLSMKIMFSPSSQSISGSIFGSTPRSTPISTPRSLAANRTHLMALAKAGDVAALNWLIDNTLSPLGVEVTAIVGNDCLVVTAILPEVVDRLFLIDFLREALERLQPEGLNRVVIVGRDRARLVPDWQHILNLHQADLPQMPTPARQQQAKRKPAPKKAAVSFRRRHPLVSKPLHLVLFLAACGLLVGGVFAAKMVFTVGDGAVKPVEFTN
jgi:hypothetical protein